VVFLISCFARLELRLCFIVQLKLYVLSCTDLMSRDYSDRQYLRHFSSAYQHNKIRTPLPILFHRKHILIHILGGEERYVYLPLYFFSFHAVFISHTGARAIMATSLSKLPHHHHHHLYISTPNTCIRQPTLHI
jgi:hypothetical protein